jgi:hypothetical protein
MLIDWKEDWIGYIGGERWFSVVPKPKFHEGTHGVQLLWHMGMIDKMYLFETTDQAKAKAESLFQDWLTKADLIQKPVRCSECGDSGEISKIVSVGFLVNKCTDPCECRDNKNSMYNFLNGGVI